MKKQIKKLPTSYIATKEDATPKMSNHIEEYFTKIEGTKEAFHARELFKATRDDVDIKTHLGDEEIALITKIKWFDDLLKRKKLVPIYTDFLYNYMRLKISKDRLSRTEFVNINKTNNPEDAINLMSNLSNITGTKK